MEPGAYSLVSSALLHQRRLQTLTNNLANVNTIGFKADTPTFRVLPNRVEGPDPAFIRQMAVHRIEWASSSTNFRPGAIKHTANSLDIALNGSGFFVLRAPDGLRYTRAGEFTLNNQGEIVTGEGWQLQGKGGAPIRVPSASLATGGISINKIGEVRVDGEAMGRIEVVDFPTPYLLRKEGATTFMPVDRAQQGVPVEEVDIIQGALEQSNVSAISEMVRLIALSREFEAYQKILMSFDEVEDRAINDLGRANRGS